MLQCWPAEVVRAIAPHMWQVRKVDGEQWVTRLSKEQVNVCAYVYAAKGLSMVSSFTSASMARFSGVISNERYIRRSSLRGEVLRFKTMKRPYKTKPWCCSTGDVAAHLLVTRKLHVVMDESGFLEHCWEIVTFCGSCKNELRCEEYVARCCPESDGQWTQEIMVWDAPPANLQWIERQTVLVPFAPDPL